MDKTLKIYIAGHRGLVGSAIKREFEIKDYSNLKIKPVVILYNGSYVVDLEDNSDVPVFLLDNYRSTQNIVAAANSLIKKNSFQIPKKPNIVNLFLQY